MKDALRNRLLLLAEYKVIHAKAVLASANAFACVHSDDAAIYWHEASHLAGMAVGTLQNLASVVDTQAGETADNLLGHNRAYFDGAMHVGKLCAESLLDVSNIPLASCNDGEGNNLRGIAEQYRILSEKAKAVAEIVENTPDAP
jgi:hypothetical protein